MEEKNPSILTVTQLTQAIKLSLEASFSKILLQGEISNFKMQTSGHLYFCLKDAQAQISAVMFRTDAVSLRLIPKDGDHVMVKGEMNVYPPKGNYQIVVRELTQIGLGELLIKLEELKRKIQKKGWFSKEHKKPLPKMPKRIGIVTSPTGAVIQDILNILNRRFTGVHVILNPVRVQGEGAAKEIAQAIEQFNRYEMVDVMIVGRGGGSIEDLWAFNEEIVAEAIFNSRIPIICAVGHETDHSIAEYVADVRAPTPSAAAEIVISEKAHHIEHLRQVERRLYQTVGHLVNQGRHRLSAIMRQPILTAPYALLGMWMQKIDDLRIELDWSLQQYIQRKRIHLEGTYKQLQALRPTNQILHLRNRFSEYDKNIKQTFWNRQKRYRENLKNKQESLHRAWFHKKDQIHRLFQIQQKRRQLDQQLSRALLTYRERLTNIAQTLHAVNPKNLLQKGYSILFAEKSHSVIKSISSLVPEQSVRILLSDGEATAIVTNLSNGKG